MHLKICEVKNYDNAWTINYHRGLKHFIEGIKIILCSSIYLPSCSEKRLIEVGFFSFPSTKIIQFHARIGEL